jgi:hypothetical protein
LIQETNLTLKKLVFLYYFFNYDSHKSLVQYIIRQVNIIDNPKVDENVGETIMEEHDFLCLHRVVVAFGTQNKQISFYLYMILFVE